MSGRARIVVVGSANMDLVVRVDHIPAPGETVLGGGFVTVPGGKGANQAVAAARLGGDVAFVGRVGDDAFGETLANGLRADGIDIGALTRDPDRPTGVALIGVDAYGQNAIIVAPGANHGLTPADIDSVEEAIAAASLLVIQLEIPISVVIRAVEVARSNGTRVLMNPAPIRDRAALRPELLAQVQLITPNEHEAASLLGLDGPNDVDWIAGARRLRSIVGGDVVVTLGADGCVLATSAGEIPIRAPFMAAVNTTAAGDCFTGALAAAIAEGEDLVAACRFATRAAALSVTRFGAQSSLPTRAEVAAVAS